MRLILCCFIQGAALSYECSVLTGQKWTARNYGAAVIAFLIDTLPALFVSADLKNALQIP